MQGSDLFRGRVDKSVVGSASNSLLHHIVFYKGGAVAVKFLTMAQVWMGRFDVVTCSEACGCVPAVLRVLDRHQ